MKANFTTYVLTVVLVLGVPTLALGADWADPGDYIIAGVIGASYERAQAPETFPVAPNSWYWGGKYKTWVDFLSSMQSRNYHWLNYAKAGDVSINGTPYLNELLANTTVLDETDQPTTTVELLIIGFWGNDILWIPGYDQDTLDAMIANVQEQIAIAKAAGIEKIIVLGWPDYEDFDLDYFVSMFPESLPFHIDESGYNQIKDYYYQVFAEPNPDFLFVEPWCNNFKTFDGVHPAEVTSMKAAMEVYKGLRLYDRLVGRASLSCR